MKTQWWRPRHSAALLALMLIFTAITSVLLPSTRASAVGSIYLSPASSSVVHGNNVTVSLRINPTTAVTVVQATINFDPTALQYVSIDASASPFDTNVQQTTSGSTVQISRAKLDANGISTDSLIANVTFKALPYSGSSSLTLTNANAAFNGTYTNPSSSGASVSFTPGTCPSGQVGTPPSCTTAPTSGGGTTTGGTTTPTKTTTPTTTTSPTTASTTPTSTSTPTPTTSTTSLTVPAVTKEDAQYTTLTITATTNIKAQAYLLYGTTHDALSTKSALSALNTAHSLTVNTGLTPGQVIYYKVVATVNGQTQSSDVKSVTLKGLTVRVALLDKNMNPIVGQQVTLDPSGATVTSDNKGVATFTGLMSGDYTVAIKSDDGKAHQQHIVVLQNVASVLGAETAADQSQAAIFDNYTAQPRVIMYWPWAVLVLIIAFAIWVLWSYRHNGRVHVLVNRVRERLSARKLKDVPIGSFTPFDSTATPQEFVEPTPHSPTPPPTNPTEPTAYNPFEQPSDNSDEPKNE